MWIEEKDNWYTEVHGSIAYLDQCASSPANRAYCYTHYFFSSLDGNTSCKCSWNLVCTSPCWSHTLLGYVICWIVFSLFICSVLASHMWLVMCIDVYVAVEWSLHLDKTWRRVLRERARKSVPKNCLVVPKSIEFSTSDFRLSLSRYCLCDDIAAWNFISTDCCSAIVLCTCSLLLSAYLFMNKMCLQLRYDCHWLFWPDWIWWERTPSWNHLCNQEHPWNPVILCLPS